MPINILMPALSPTMEEGKLAKWLVKEGDAVRSGDIIAEIETDKATMEVEAVDEGTIGKIMVVEGAQGVPVNQLIAVLLEEGEDASAIDLSKVGAAATIGRAGQPVSPNGGAQSVASGEGATVPSPSMDQSRADDQRGPDQRLFASPLARRLAAQGNIDIALLNGSGPHGRIVKHDVEAAIKNGVGHSSPAATGAVLSPSPTPLRPMQQLSPSQSPAVQMSTGMPDKTVLALYEPGSYDIVPHDGMRRIIAERLTLSKQTIPHFYLNVDCRLDSLLAARKRLNDRAPKDGPRAFKLSVNDFIIKAMALALQDVPAANTTWTAEGTLFHKRSDVGVAVAVEGGLFTPVIRHADLKTLSEISNEMKDLAGRARNKRLAPHEYQGGTTSISNLGMYGVKSFDAVINPPHASILAVGAGQEQAIAVEGQIEAATIMAVTLSCDHRVVDGAIGAELLGAFKGFIEDPVRMLV